MANPYVLFLTKDELETVRFALQYTSDLLALNIHHVPLLEESDTARLRRVGHCQELLHKTEKTWNEAKKTK